MFLDTPGFDDANVSDIVVLDDITKLVEKKWEYSFSQLFFTNKERENSYKKRINFVTILYLHTISQNRATGTFMKNVKLFANFSSQKPAPAVTIATTMWSEVEEDIGTRREDELERDYFKELLQNGCDTERFDGTADCAWRIIDNSQKHRPEIKRASEKMKADGIDDPAQSNPGGTKKKFYRTWKLPVYSKSNKGEWLACQMIVGFNRLINSLGT